MGPLPSERRGQPERRLMLDRRSGDDRRQTPAIPVAVERRTGSDRRLALQRRSGVDRRLSLQSVEEHLRGAVRLLTRVADHALLGDEQRRELDSALLRLKFALDQIAES